MHIMKSFPLFRPVTTATWPLPSSEGCRPPYTASKCFGRVYELGGNARGDPWCGRPARYMRKTGLGHKLSTYASILRSMTPAELSGQHPSTQGPVPWAPDIPYSLTMPPPPPPLSVQPPPLTRTHAIPFMDSPHHNHFQWAKPGTIDECDHYRQQLPPLAATETWSIHSTMKEIHARQLVRPGYHPHLLPNLARLHGSVNWHSHCTCEVYWLVLGRYALQVWYWPGIPLASIWSQP